MSQIAYAAEDLAGNGARRSAPNTPLTRYVPGAGGYSLDARQTRR
jgi:hypothetical protein